MDNKLSNNLDRINNSTNQIRSVTGTENASIEEVAVAVTALSEDNAAKTEEIATLNQTIEEITPSGTLDIASNGTFDVSSYEYANVNIEAKALEEKEVNFIDYDGTILYSYTAEEFLALNSFPDLVSPKGFTAQQWNYDYDAAVVYVTKYGRLDIGQTVVTEDDITRIYIDLKTGLLKPTLRLGMAGTATIDWGDGSQSTFTGTSYGEVYEEHTYSEPGKYIIQIIPESTSTKYQLTGADNTYVLYDAVNSRPNGYQATAIYRMDCGSGIRFGSYGISQWYHLETLNIPKGALSSIPSYMLYFPYSLKCLVLPLGITSLPSYGLYGLISAKYIIFPSTLTTTADLALSEPSSMKHYYLPEGVTKICQRCSPCSGNNLTHVIIPESVTAVEGRNFIANSINWVYFGATSNKSTGSEFNKYAAIFNSVQLTDFIFAEGVKSITGGTSSYKSFENVRNLGSLVFPSTFTSIGNYCLTCCYSLMLIDLRKPQRKVTLGTKSITDLNTACQIVVPDAYYDSYIADSAWVATGGNIIKASDYEAALNA